MTPDLAMPPAVYTWWMATLAVTLVIFVPLTVYLLQTLFRTTASINRYARESLTAAAGIVHATEPLSALDTTIAVAGEMVALAEDVAKKLETIAQVLAARAR